MEQQGLLERRMRGWVYEAGQDVVGLWELCRAARDDWGTKTAEESKTLVLGFVHELLANGIKAINIGDGRPWLDQRPDSVIERISREWDALGREPNVPDIVWFKKTS
jgi:hypothetical protein